MKKGCLLYTSLFAARKVIGPGGTKGAAQHRDCCLLYTSRCVYETGGRARIPRNHGQTDGGITPARQGMSRLFRRDSSGRIFYQHPKAGGLGWEADGRHDELGLSLIHIYRIVVLNQGLVVDQGDFQHILHHATDSYTKLLVEKRTDVMRRYSQVLGGKERVYA